MPAYYPESEQPTKPEPLRRFYPAQGMQSQPSIPSAPVPVVPPQAPSLSQIFPKAVSSQKKKDDASYFMHRHPILLQRLYDAADIQLSAYRSGDFIYDAYPDYLSLRLMRDRILRENRILTEEFLQTGCTAERLNLLTDTILSDLLCRKRRAHRNPNGDASTTSVQSASLS